MKTISEIMAKTARVVNGVAVEKAAGVTRVDGRVTDSLDDEFLSWMSTRADEDLVVKVAMSCSHDHKKMKAGEKCRSCGEMAKTASDEENLTRIMRGSVPSDEILPKAMSAMRTAKLKSLVKGGLAGAALTAGAGALYLKGRRDQRAKTAGIAQHQDNLDLLSRIRARAAQGLTIDGDA